MGIPGKLLHIKVNETNEIQTIALIPITQFCVHTALNVKFHSDTMLATRNNSINALHTNLCVYS